jgi:hypothetical protein
MLASPRGALRLLGAALIVLFCLTGCGGSHPARIRRPQHAIFCPSNARPDQRFDARILLGISERTARAQASKHGCFLRVAERDGRLFALTADFRVNRLDIKLRHGVVVSVWLS